MIPHRISRRSDFRAYGTFALIAITVLFFCWEVVLSVHYRTPIDQHLGNYALRTCDVAQQPLLKTVVDGVRSLFLHQTFTQFLTNMIFLWIFGSTVEKFFGHKRFLLFFLVAGFGGHVLSILFNRDIDNCLSLIGPAGAIAGVLGAFVWLHPARRIETYVPLLSRKFDLPGIFFVGLYFALSIFILDLGPLSGQIEPFWDEAGGFLTGLGIIFIGTMLKPAPRGDPFEYLDK